MIPEPTIIELIQIGKSAVQGSADKNADFVRGSDYEALAGPFAISWSREASYSTDLFYAVNFNTADGEGLTVMAKKRYGYDRVLDTRGQGVATLARPVGGISETIWKGTRLAILGPQIKLYRVTEDTPALSTDLEITVPIESINIGVGVAANVSGSNLIRIDDPLEDTSWTANRLICADGTVFEQADAFRTRIRTDRLDQRVGQSKRLIKACKDAGAGSVALFRCDYAGDAYDYGLNYCYVGDLGNNGTPELVKACFLALRKVRVAGDNMQVLPMARVSLDVTAKIYLERSPHEYDLTRFERIHKAAITQYLNGVSGTFSFSLSGIQGAIIRPLQEVRKVELIAPSSDDPIVVGPMRNLPPVLNRYIVGNINLSYETL